MTSWVANDIPDDGDFLLDDLLLVADVGVVAEGVADDFRFRFVRGALGASANKMNTSN